MIKLIASDMDGTLLGKDHDISEENLKAIRKAEEMGVHFVIASGRIYDDIKPFLNKYDLKCECIVLNGAEYIDKNGNIIEGIYMDKGGVKDILNIMEEDGLNVEIYTDKGIYTTNNRDETLNYIDDIDELLKTNVKIGKIEAYNNSQDKVLESRKKLENIDGVAVSSSVGINMEVNHIDAQKGIILAKVIEKMGIKKEEVVVIGDGLNDYSMFDEFPVSFAMENAITEIKEIAKYITDTNDNSGVAKAINKVLQEY